MGVVQSNPTFYHPDLLAVFSINGLNPFKSPKWSRYSDNINDPGWVRNSPLRNELVDLLNDALKAMGGWPKYSGCCCGYHLFQIVPPQLVEAFNKVCKKFNDTKLFDMGLQCRAIIIRHISYAQGVDFTAELLCLWKKEVTNTFAMWAKHTNTLVGWRRFGNKHGITVVM